MSAVAYRLPDGEEIAREDRNLRMARARADIARLLRLRQQAEAALVAVEDALSDLQHAQRL